MRGMIRTLEIPRARWETALSALTRQIGGRAIRVQVIGRLLGDQEMTELLPFRGIEFDPRGSERGSLTVSAGSDEAPFEHRIFDPTAVYLALNERGEIEWLGIEERGDDGIARTIIQFEQLPELPSELGAT